MRISTDSPSVLAPRSFDLVQAWDLEGLREGFGSSNSDSRHFAHGRNHVENPPKGVDVSHTLVFNSKKFHHQWPPASAALTRFRETVG